MNPRPPAERQTSPAAESPRAAAPANALSVKDGISAGSAFSRISASSSGREMERSGCTYVYTGLESASNEMLRAMGKDEDRLDIDSAFKILRETSVRVGLSLFFAAKDWFRANR